MPMQDDLRWLACSLLLAAGTVHAQTEKFFDLSLEELMEVNVASAGLFHTTVGKAPGYVQVFDMDQVANTPVRTLGDLLSMHAVGSSVGNHERQGAIHGVRGILVDNGAKTLVMLDGQQINQRSHFGYMTGLRSPLLGDLQTVEVINGPGAIQHGSGAINGFINLLPKTGASHPGTFARAEFGFAEDLWLAEGGQGWKYGENRHVYVYGGTFAAAGFEPDEDWGMAKAYDQDVDAHGFTTPNYRVSTTWTYDAFDLNAFSQEINTQKNNNQEAGDFHTQSLGLRPRYTFGQDADESVELAASLVMYDHAEGRGGGRELHGEAKATLRSLRMDRHALAVGALVGYKEFDAAKQYFAGDLDAAFESVDTDWYEYGVFAEDVIDCPGAVTLSLGARYDLYALSPVSGGPNFGDTSYSPDDPDGHISPRVALAWEATPALNVKASYQHGFRMPDAAYYDWNLANNRAAEALGLARSGPLDPEEMDGFELNISQSVNPDLSVNANLYYNMFRDQLSWGPLENVWTDEDVEAINAYNDVTWGGGMFQNINDEFNVYGAELAAHWQMMAHTRMNVSYGVNEMDDDDIVRRYPSHQVKLNTTSSFRADTLIASLSYLYNSGYDADDAPAVADVYQDDRHLADLSLIYRFRKNASAKLVVQNVLGGDTPPTTFRMDRPVEGNSGADETRVYLSCSVAM